MVKGTISRREFLRVFSPVVAGVFFPTSGLDAYSRNPEEKSSTMLGRITRKSVDVRAQPDIQSPRLRVAERDTILSLLEEVNSPAGPKENPRWYRLGEGYIHSAYVQRVDKAHLSLPLSQVPEKGLLGEVTVPYTQTLYKNRKGEQVKLYRLYFQSLHWITGLVEGPDGKPWYRLTDEWLRVHYYVPATHLRSIPSEELKPISPDVPEQEKLIEVLLDKQTLTAYERGYPVFQTMVSTGRRFMETPSGEFQVNRKFPSKHMGDGGLTSDLNAYELVGVPWVSFFHNNGVAFHGTFWHDNFGSKMSQGCVNMRNEAARWLFRWCAPIYGPEVEFRSGYKRVGQGTKVIVAE